MSAMSAFKKGGPEKVEAFQKTAKKEDFERIKRDWSVKCEALGLTLGPKVMKELQKRVDSCLDIGGGKAKLDLKDMGLVDKQVKALLEVLAQAPILAKLELSKNIISDEVSSCGFISSTQTFHAVLSVITALTNETDTHPSSSISLSYLFSLFAS